MADVAIDVSALSQGSTVTYEHNIVWTDKNTGYCFFIDGDTVYRYRKTTDAGLTWGTLVDVDPNVGVRPNCIWYDQWTPGDTGSIIHCVYSDAGDDDIFYRSLDTSDDSLSSIVVVFAGISFGSINRITVSLSITKARGGNLYVAMNPDNGGETGFYRSTDGGATWTTRADPYETSDRLILQPGNEADNQDIWAFYKDVSADELSIKVYDNSADSWSETSIATSIIEGDGDFLLFGAACRHSDNHSILASWSDYDVSTADLLVWDIGGSGDITAKTNVLDNTIEGGDCRVFINQQNDDIYVVYIKGGTLLSTTEIFYKKSTDGGTTWGSETAFSENAADDIRHVASGHSVGNDGGRFMPVWFNDDINDWITNNVNSVEIAAATAAAKRRRVGMGAGWATRR